MMDDRTRKAPPIDCGMTHTSPSLTPASPSRRRPLRIVDRATRGTPAIRRSRFRFAHLPRKTHNFRWTCISSSHRRGLAEPLATDAQPEARKENLHTRYLPRRLRRHVRADHRRQGAARRYRSHRRGGEGLHHLRRGGEVRRRQGDPRRHGPEPGLARRGRRRHRHNQRADHRPHRHLQGRRRPQGRPHRRHRQGRQPGRAAGVTSSSAQAPRRSPARARSSPPAAWTATSTSSARSRSRRRSTPASPRCSAAAPAPPPAPPPPPARPAPGTCRMIEAVDALPMNLAFSGKGNARSPRRCSSRSWPAPCASSCTRTGARRRRRHRLRLRGRRARRPGDDPHRHAERIRLRRGHHRRHQGPHHPRLPHRRRGRRHAPDIIKVAG